MDSEKELRIQVAIGNEINQFFNTTTGQYIIDRYEREVADLQEAFMALGESEIEKMREIHFKLQVARKTLVWLNEGLFDADKAYDLLSNGQ